MADVVSFLALFIAVLSLAVALAVMHRLRAVEGRLRGVEDPFGPDLPAPGTPVPEFATVTTAGEQVGTADLHTAEALVVFLSSDCESCRWDLPRLVSALGHADQAGTRPIVMLSGDIERRNDIVADLEAVARVVPDDAAGALTRAFGVRGFPSLLRVSHGTIIQCGHTIGELSLAAPA